MNLKESLLLAASAGFIIIWLLELIAGKPFKDGYPLIMFGVGCLLFYQYSKNMRLAKEQENSGKRAIKPNFKQPNKKKK